MHLFCSHHSRSPSIEALLPKGDRHAQTRSFRETNMKPSRDISALFAVAVLGVGIGLAAIAAPAMADLAFISVEPYALAIADTSTNTVLGTVPVNNLPEVVAVSPDGSRAYVAIPGDGVVDVVDLTTRTIIAQPGVPSGNTVITSANGKWVYATSGSNIDVIDTSTNTVVRVVPTGLLIPAYLGLTHDGTKLVVSDEDSASTSFVIVDTTTFAVTPITVPGLGRCDGVAVSPTAPRAYIACLGSGVVQIVDTSANTVVGTIQNLPGAFYGAVSPDGNTLYVSAVFQNTVYVINLASNSLRTQFAYNGPIGLAVSADNKTLFVASTAVGTLGEFDTTSLAANGTLTLPGGSLYIALLAGTVPFSQFSPTVTLTPLSFSFSASFTLGSTATALMPNTQSMTLTIGGLTVTLPAGALQLSKPTTGQYSYTGAVNGINLAVRLQGKNLGPYSVSVTGTGYNFTGAGSPLPVSLTIGNNKGTASVNPTFKGKPHA